MEFLSLTTLIDLSVSTTFGMIGGMVSGILTYLYSSKKERDANLKALIILLHSKISTFAESISSVITVNKTQTNNKIVLPERIEFNMPPSLNIDAKQLENFFVLCQSQELIYDISRLDVASTMLSFLSKSDRSFEAETTLILNIIVSCYTCTEALEHLFQEKYGSQEASKYCKCDSATYKAHYASDIYVIRPQKKSY